MGDLAAVETAYGLKPESLSQKQNQTKFRNPDRVNSAKEELRKLVSEYYPGTHSRMIAPYLSLTENKSRSFQVFLDGINKILKEGNMTQSKMQEQLPTPKSEDKI